MATTKKTVKIGRPTKYKQEYCQLLIDQMAMGYSFEAFAADLSVSKQTLYTWTEQHQDFMDAKKLGDVKSLKFWEQIGIGGAMGQIPGFNLGAFVFCMKNKHGWTDRTDLKIDATVNEYHKEFGLLRDIPRKELIAIAKKAVTAA